VVNEASPWSAVLALQQAAHASLHFLSAQLSEFGLTGSELNALANLQAGQGRTVSDLAAAAGIRASTMTSVLDRLERRGLVTRRSAPGDRRAVLVELTTSGQSAAGEIREAMFGLERRAFADLSADAIAGLRAGLRALAEVSL
jgi:MarR family transcriptional regulator, organic hydroperoxide resistance regulator